MNKKEQRAELRRLVWAAAFAQNFQKPAEAVEHFDILHDKVLPLVEDGQGAARTRVLNYLGAAADLTDADRAEIDDELGLKLRIVRTPDPRYYTAVPRWPEQFPTFVTLAYSADEARVQARAGLDGYLKKQKEGGGLSSFCGFSEDPFTEVRPSTDAEILFPKQRA